jgi:hypothetical protein
VHSAQDPEEQTQSIAMMDIIYKGCQKLLIVFEDVVFNPEEIRVEEKYDV